MSVRGFINVAIAFFAFAGLFVISALGNFSTFVPSITGNYVIVFGDIAIWLLAAIWSISKLRLPAPAAGRASILPKRVWILKILVAAVIGVAVLRFGPGVVIFGMSHYTDLVGAPGERSLVVTGHHDGDRVRCEGLEVAEFLTPDSALCAPREFTARYDPGRILHVVGKTSALGSNIVPIYETN